MYCNQCEQTAKGVACTVGGVCGKNDELSQSQSQLIYALRLLSSTALKARAKGVIEKEIDHFVVDALFATLTNVSFDKVEIDKLIESTVEKRKNLARKLGCKPDSCANASIDKIKADFQNPDKFAENEDVRSALQILLYGVKGLAAYISHAQILGQEDENLYKFVYEALVAGQELEPVERDLAQWLSLILDCGKANIRAMELLERGNTEKFGHPVPTKVSLGHKKGKCILISGHDLHDLEDLLKQTENTGINVYTHGEMLPAHGYPELHKYKHLVGHYGTAWQNQQKEMAEFPGAVLFTTNCIQNPKAYADKVFTNGMVSWDNIVHCQKNNFTPIISKALSLEGFAEDKVGQEITVGFGKNTLLSVAPKLLELVQKGSIKHIFLVGGCDGAKSGRNYYTEFVEKAPKDTLILTLACGKFRFFDQDLGDIEGIPRLIDIGQCNDAYAAVQVALALADALKCSVNDLPLSFILSWYEQKAVVILLSLLALDVKNIRLGPSLPAFISPNILKVLVDKFAIAPISTVEADMKSCLGK